jgi:hypothetical protein
LDISQLTLLATITASDSVDSLFSAVAGTSSVAVSVPRGTLPNGSVLEAYTYSDTATARAILTKAGDFILQAVIAWRAPDGTTPVTNPGKAVSVTVTSADIRAGSRVYSIIGGVATVVGIATADGTATFLLTEDPVVVITPTVPDAPTGVGASNGGSQTASVTWQAPAINGGSPITGYTATSNTGQSCSTTSLMCNVTGLTNGTPSTFTVVARNAIGASDSSTATAAVIPLSPGLTPTFSTPVAVAAGFTVNITNYDASYAWAITVNNGAVAIGTASGSVIPLTVSGLTSAQSAIITANTTRTGYASGNATVSGTSLGVYVVTFDATTNSNTKYNKLIFGGIIERDNTADKKGIKYKIRITQHINNLINSTDANLNKNVRLGLTVTENINYSNSYYYKNPLSLNNPIMGTNDVVEYFPVASIMEQQGVVLHGTNPSTEDASKKLKLVIHYTKPN